MNFKDFKEKMWRRKLPKEFRNCTDEEMTEHINRLREEFSRLDKDTCTEEELLCFLLRNEKLLMAMEVIQQYQFEQRIKNGRSF